MKIEREPRERNFEAAREIVAEMCRRHEELEPLRDDQISGLARVIYRFERFRDVHNKKDNIPSDSLVFKVLEQTQKAMEVLGRLDNPETNAQVHALGVIDDRIPLQPDQLGDKLRLNPIFKIAATYAPILKIEIENLTRKGFIPTWSGKPMERSERRTKTILMGKKIPEVFRRFYPDRSFGSTDRSDNSLKGYGYTFTHKFMICLGYEGITFENIKAARRNTGDVTSG